jgi:hypothetical protein
LLERIEGEAVRLLCPELADVLVRRETFERLEVLGEVVRGNEVPEVASKLVMGFVIEAFDRRILDRPVHAFDLAIGPRMLGLGEAMIDVGSGTSHRRLPIRLCCVSCRAFLGEQCQMQ